MLIRSYIANVCGLLLLLSSDLIFAVVHIMEPGGASLNEVLENTVAGDTIRLRPGVYAGAIINQSVHLIGDPGSVLDGNGEGNVLQVYAANVIIEGLEIRNSGNDLNKMNAGIFVEKDALNVEIRNNKFNGNLFGIWLDACHYPKLIANKIVGDVNIRSQDRGNGIHLYAVYHGLIKDNEVWNTRDGIYIESSNNNRIIGNFLHDLRYGVHYMYSYSNTVSENHTLNTRTGYALMQSKFLTVTGNRSENDGNYGILLNFITKSTITDNVIIGTHKGRAYATGGSGITGAEGKAFFVYNSHFNTMANNYLQGADIGIHLTAGSEDNVIYGNDFVENHIQVKYVATRTQEWSQQGKGNYWSDYLGWDIDADGIGDRPYEPNDAVDKLLWRYPLARILLNSPAINTLRWVQEHFPVLRPQGVQDSYPLMKVSSPQEINL